MKEKVFIVLDQGSSGPRALAVNSAGEITVKKHKELPPAHSGPGMAQYDAARLLEAQISVFKEVLSQSKNVSSISVCSQRSTIVLWDKKTGLPVAPALTWQDGRGKQISDAVQIPQTEIHKKTGLYKTPFFSASKITWCLNNIERAAACAKAGNLLIGPAATYIIWRLTDGKIFAVDPTLAQRTLLFNINTFDWDEDLLKAFSVQKKWLPEIKNTLDDYGSYDGIPIKVCAGDQQAAFLGLGARKEGDCAVNYGTGAFLFVNAGEEFKSIPGILTSVGAATPESPRNFILEGPVNAAGALFAWLNEAGIFFDINELDEICARAKNPVWFLPAFNGLGAPYWDFETQTVMTGFTTATKKEDIIAGAARALSFLISDIYFYLKKSGVKTGGVKVSGGLARNDGPLQFQADILQTPLARAVEGETTALGAAALAAKAEGVDADKWEVFNSERVFTPQITPAQARELADKWRGFFDWCKSYKG